MNCLALQPDGKLLVGGSFFTVDSVTRPFVARFNTAAGVPPAVLVSIAATKKMAYEESLAKGKFTVTRAGGNPTGALIVNYTVSGPATPAEPNPP